MTSNLLIHIIKPYYLHYRTYPNSSAVGVRLPDGEPASERLEGVKAKREFFSGGINPMKEAIN